MKYEDIKDFNQRCEEHPAHQTGMISERMIQARLSEEIDELRAYIEQRTWVGLTDEEIEAIWYAFHDREMGYAMRFTRAIEAKLKQKNGYAEENT